MSTSQSDAPAATSSPIPPLQNNTIPSFIGGLETSASLYSTAIENTTGLSKFDDGRTSDNNTTLGGDNPLRKHSPTEFEDILQGMDMHKAINLQSLKTLHQNESMHTLQSDALANQTGILSPISSEGKNREFQVDNNTITIMRTNDKIKIIKNQNPENTVVVLKDESKSLSEIKLSPCVKTSPNEVNSEAQVLCSNSVHNMSKIAAEAFIAQREDNAMASPTYVYDDKNPDHTGQTEVKREIKVYDTLEEFEQHMPTTVTKLDTPCGSTVYLVGTAHFSEESQDDVSQVIRNVRPDVVMVELCPSRAHILVLDEKTLLEEAKNFNLSKIRGIIQTHGYINGIFFILLLQMSAQIAKDLGMAPGGEFRRAYEEVNKLPGCVLHLGDRPISVTLHRALSALSLWQTVKLVWRLTSTDTISIQEVEECKQRDLLEKLMQEMAGEFPAFSDVFVKERDMYLCHSLQLASMPLIPTDGSNLPRPVRVVGVVGIGHANGVAEMWGKVDPSCIPEIMEIPPASRSTRIFNYTVKYGFIALTLYGSYKILRPKLTGFF